MCESLVPSLPHEILVRIVREHPSVLLELLHRGLGIDLGVAAELIAAPTSIAEVEPAELRADAVLRVEDPEGPHALVVEVQLAIDKRKRLRWPTYVCGLRDRLGCAVTLVVVTLDDEVASWARAPIVLDRIGSKLYAAVLGPSDFPALVEAADAARHPELALMAFLARAKQPAATDLGRAVLRACTSLDAQRAALYTDIVFAFADVVARRILEAEMQIENYEFQSDLVRGLIARGRDEGREEGREEGEAIGLQRAVLAVLAARSLTVSHEIHARITRCVDVAQLHTWLVLAATASDADAID